MSMPKQVAVKSSANGREQGEYNVRLDAIETGPLPVPNSHIISSLVAMHPKHLCALLSCIAQNLWSC